MQDMNFFFNRWIANETPIERQVGNAGGTAIVTKSNPLKIVSLNPINPSSSPSI